MHKAKRSHTRGVPLANLAGFCFVLGKSRCPLSVRDLANHAIATGIVDFAKVQAGEILPTRLNHHIIALRELDLVESKPISGHVFYNLNAVGQEVRNTTVKSYSGKGPVSLDHDLRATWRWVLAQSYYVRNQWLKYFMPRESFSLEDLMASSSHVTFVRSESTSQEEARQERKFILATDNWGEQILDEQDRRELHQGLRRWTNEAYLTDDRLPENEMGPFSYVKDFGAKDSFQMQSHLVKAWFDPRKDIGSFERIVNQVLDERQQGNRISIPELIIELCVRYDYAKDNIKEMLIGLFYERGSNYFFERGSKFLVDHAFNLRNKDKPSIYYLKLEGVWRTSLVRYGRA